jgi:hypothetical protein
MANIKYLLFYCLLGISLLSCAQTKKLVKNIYATYTVHLPGNVAVDKYGNSLAMSDTVSIIYIETSSDIQWSQAWRNGKHYFINKVLITESPFDAGTDKITNEKIMLHSAKGNKLWKLQLIPEDKNFKTPVTTLPGEIIIEGTYNGKKIQQKISNQREVEAIPAV